MILIIIENIDGIKFGIFIQEFATTDRKNFRLWFDYFLYNNEDFIFSLNDMKIYNAHFHYEMRDPHYGFKVGHYEAISDMFIISGVCQFYEKDN